MASKLSLFLAELKRRKVTRVVLLNGWAGPSPKPIRRRSINYRVVPFFLLLALASRVAHAQEPGSRQSEDDQIVLAVESLARRPAHRTEEGWVNCWTAGEVAGDHDCLAVNMVLVRVKNGRVGRPANLTSGSGLGWNAILVDTDGIEYESLFIMATAITENMPEGVWGEYGGGSQISPVFPVSKVATPAVLRWTYAHWNSQEGLGVKRVEIEVDLRAVR